jgi:hypothetical protein
MPALSTMGRDQDANATQNGESAGIPTDCAKVSEVGIEPAPSPNFDMKLHAMALSVQIVFGFAGYQCVAVALARGRFSGVAT